MGPAAPGASGEPGEPGPYGSGPFPTTRVVVPCYNEADRMPVETFAAYAASEPRVRFVLVDDGSRDGTRAMLEGLAERAPAAFEVLALPRNRGKAEAVRAGVLRALELAPAAEEPLFGFLDADLATPLEAVPMLARRLAAAPGCAMVLASRVKLMGFDIQRKAHRHYLGRVFATVASIVLDLPVYDTQCGAKLFRRRADVEALFAEPFLSRWIFDVELLARFCAAGAAPAGQIIEQPLPCWRDVGVSKVKPGDFLVALGDMWRIHRRYRARRRRRA